MFIGHYGPALALKSADEKTPLWVYFLAVQFVDILFFSFVLVGIEKMNIVPGFTAYNSYDLYCYPYTHSLLASVLWFLGTYALAYLYFNRRKMDFPKSKFYALLIAIAVFSHFLTDIMVHTADLPLWNNESPKIGLGLWNNVALTMALEILLILAGAYMYHGSAIKSGFIFSNKKFVVVMLLLCVLAIMTPLLPEPESVNQLALQGLLSFFIIGGLGYWIER